jgi:hypothetical protein
VSHLLGVFLISVAVSAQRQADAAGLRVVLSHINDGAALRVRVAAGPRLSGRYAGILGDTMFLGSSGGATRLRTAALDSLWMRQRPIVSKGIRGALIGALLGGVVGLARSLRASCHTSEIVYPTCRWWSVGSLARSAAKGAVIGGAAGSALGVAFPVWRLRFP